MTQHDLLLFGATRHTGLHIAQLAKQQCKRVAVMARKESDTRALKKLDVRIIEGDAFDFNDCNEAIKQTQPHSIISLIGGKNAQGRRACAEGNINVIQALALTPTLKRFVLFSAIVCGHHFQGRYVKPTIVLGASISASP